MPGISIHQSPKKQGCLGTNVMNKEKVMNHHVKCSRKENIKYRNNVVSLQTILLSVAMEDRNRTSK